MLQGYEVQVEARVEVGAGCFRLQYFREREFSQEFSASWMPFQHLT